MLEEIYSDCKAKMEKSVEATSQQLAHIRTGKASPALFENIKVDYYGSKTPLKQIASIAVPEARMIVIQPWDKNALQDIEKAILQSDLGLNPMNDGNVLRISIPALTEERRKDLVRVVKTITEEGKIALRTVRRDIINTIKTFQKDGDIPEDASKKAQDHVQDITNEYSDKIDHIFKIKEKEILTI
ncbi:ribosome recycling factor [bacterium]|nr:ribosome recycling factor [bacterium]